MDTARVFLSSVRLFIISSTSSVIVSIINALIAFVATKRKKGRIHGNPVADGWAGAVMLKPLAIQKYFGPTDRHGKV